MFGLFIPPQTFETGRAYLRLQRRLNGRRPPIESVTFETYCACPAFVVVRDMEGVRRRLPREELYEMVGVFEK